MATGRRAFEATTQASLIAKILETEPPAVSSLAPLTPPALDHVVQGCLAKEPADRWQTAHDVKMQLQWIQAQGSRSDAARQRRVPRRRTAWLPWVVAAAVCARSPRRRCLLLGRDRWRRTAPPVRFELVLPPEMRQADIVSGAISPDGQRFVFEANVDGRDQLVVRDMASTALVVLPGTEGGFSPFWSPDSRSVAFFALRTRPAQNESPMTGGPARVLADDGAELDVAIDGTWRDGMHPVRDRATGAFIASRRREARPPLSRRSRGSRDRRRFASPRFLPDGRHFLVKRGG